MISNYNDNLMEEEVVDRFSTPLLRLLDDHDTATAWCSAPSTQNTYDISEDTTYFRKAQIDAINTLKQNDDTQDKASLFVPLEQDCLYSDDQDCWNFNPCCDQIEEQLSCGRSPRTISTGFQVPLTHLESRLKSEQLDQDSKLNTPDLTNQPNLATARSQDPEIPEAEDQDIGSQERVVSFTKKMKKSSEESIYAKDELSKKILRHLTTYDRKKIRKMTPKSVRKLKARQLDYVRKYFWKEYELEEEIMQRIQRSHERMMITLFCSLDVRLSQQKRTVPDKDEALDRKKLINGQKDTVIALLSSQLGKRVYLKPFCKLWLNVVDAEIAGSGFEEDFLRYLDDIKAAVV